MTNAARLLAAPIPRSAAPLRSASEHTLVGAEFAALRARRRRRMEAPASAGQLAAVGTLGANIVTNIESAPRARGPRRRGDVVTGLGGVVGRWVGARNGVQCIAWQGEDYATVCAAFDARTKPRR